MIICDEPGIDNDEVITDSNSGQFQTADELYEMMSSTNRIHKENEALSPIDIGLLYHNMDFGTQLINNNLNCQGKKSNQHVETIVHQEDDISYDGIDGIYTSKNDKIVCHKCGSQKLPSLTDYNKYFKFHDPFVQNHCTNKLLNNCLKLTSEVDYSFSNSVLDNVFCKRLEENFDFDLDNVIVYVNDTLDQLKRISNGDYLTNRAREKWLENTEKDINILTASTSIPLHIERKSTKALTKWDDVVHSEVDIRSLCKILEKKVVFEVPKIVKSPYKILSQSGEEGLLLQCQKKSLNMNSDETCPRVDVVFQIKRSESGHILSNINSIMILQNTMAPLVNITGSKSLLKYERSNKDLLKIEPTHETHTNSVIIDITDKNETSIMDRNPKNNDVFVEKTDVPTLEENDFTTLEKNDEALLKEENVSSSPDDTNGDSVVSSDWTHYPTTAVRTTSVDSIKFLESTENQSEIGFEVASENTTPEGLMISIQQMSKQSPVLEETEELLRKESPGKDGFKRKSPTRVKSPYANKSLAIEDKKRRRLLEIREQREKRKIALLQACKGKKNKVVQRDRIQPQASTSVTKLSITNKSFYNSIFGKTDLFKKNRKGKKDVNKKLISAENEIDVSKCEPVLSLMSFDIKCDDSSNLSLVTKPNIKEDIKNIPCNAIRPTSNKKEIKDIKTEANYYTANVVPDNTPRKTEKPNTSQGVKESIGMIYDLMNSFSAQGDTGKNVSTNFVADSESETTIKHCDVISSNPSCNSFEKSYSEKGKSDKKYTPTVPKVVISSKLQHRRLTPDKTKIYDPKQSTNNNALEAISHILHEFEHVQKCKKNSDETKKNLDETKHKYDRYNRRVKSQEINTRAMSSTLRVQQKIEIKDGKNKPATFLLPPKNDNVNIKHIVNQNLKLSDVSDEVKEARGEAVKGPSRPNTRLNVLAQPKKAYVQAHSQEFHNKYGRTLITDRLQRLVSTGLNNQELTTPGRSKIKPKKFGNDVVSPAPISDIEKYLDRRKPCNSRIASQNTLLKSKNTICLPKPLDLRNAKKPIQTIDMNSRSIPPPPIKCAVIKKSRVPFVPNDLELGHPSNVSLKEGTLEDKLNNIINKITKNDLTEVPKYIEDPYSPIYCESDNCAIATIKDITNYFDNTNTSNAQNLSNEDDQNDTPDSMPLSLKDNSKDSKSTQQKHVSFNTDPPVPTLYISRSQSASKLIPKHNSVPLKIKKVCPTFRNLKGNRPHTVPKIHSMQKTINKMKSMKEQALQTNYCEDYPLKLSYSNECCQTDQIQITDLYSNKNDRDSELNLINNISNTNSLDILVKLLNEIQNITTKQTQITKTDENNDYCYNGCNNYEPIIFCKESLSATAIDVRRSSNTHIVSVSKLREFYEPVRHIKRNVTCRIRPLTSNKRILTDSRTNSIDGSCQVLRPMANHSTEANFSFPEHKDKLKTIIENDKNSHCEENERKKVDDEHMMKIKRDVLVTVYSILVLTVFAALSLPEFYGNSF